MKTTCIAWRVAATAAWIAWNPSAPAQDYRRIDLLSDGAVQAPHVDEALVNPWGLDASPSGPFWIASAGTGTALRVLGDGRRTGDLLSIPDTRASAPTGVVHNGSSGFVIHREDRSGPSLFLFATRDGRVLGWNPDVAADSAVPAIDESAAGAQYEGIAVAERGARRRLYATNFAAGVVDVFDEQFAHVGSFTDDLVPSNFAPFGIRRFGEFLYVTYTDRRPSVRTHSPSDAPTIDGEANGYIDVFGTDGHLVKRLVSREHLDAPWGLAMAPAGFGRFGKSLLVANSGDGTITAFRPDTGAYRGVLEDEQGDPIRVSGLRAISFGNGSLGGDARTLYFTAGIDHGRHGLFGAIARNL
ncbi:MAG TPA: TIGR03118 family protein [Planctomycetota bacterium]|jgi:uncharacterized protein (TIGR03118 family)|nr:TIGR03118 family protein [Planctomycetota bacterium]